jgi:hypothetical protein
MGHWYFVEEMSMLEAIIINLLILARKYYYQYASTGHDDVKNVK